MIGRGAGSKSGLQLMPQRTHIQKMAKIGRNAPCPCGSGRKYKHCCGVTSDAQRRGPKPVAFEELPQSARKEILRTHLKMEEERRKFGHVPPLVSAEMNGYRIIGIGTTLHWSKTWKTPADFLTDYLKKTLGPDWGNAEIAKPYEDRHPIVQWYDDLCTWQREHEHEKGPDGIFGGVATGSVKAYNSIAYDLYALEHLSILQPRMLRRLRIKDQFQGARYELYVIATLLRAGFEVKLEDESDASRTHTELTAIHKGSGRKFSVEAKTCGRPGLLGKAGERRDPDEAGANIYRHLQKALLKQADHDRIVFIDVNMPPDDKETFDKAWFRSAIKTIRKVEEGQSTDDPYPPAFVVLTNNPNHYVGNDDVEPGQTSFLTAINRPEFADPDKDVMRMHPEIDQLWFSVVNHSKVPARFDDE